MPLARRVQVFISQQASDDLDYLTERLGSQKEAVESGLRALVSTYKPLVTTNVDSSLDTEAASSFNNPATADKKAARARRKEALNDSIGKSLPARADASIFDGPAPATAEKQRESARFRGSFPKPGKAK